MVHLHHLPSPSPLSASPPPAGSPGLLISYWVCLLSAFWIHQACSCLGGIFAPAIPSAWKCLPLSFVSSVVRISVYTSPLWRGPSWPHSLNSSLSAVTRLCPTLCNPMDFSMPGFPVHHQLPELAQTHGHWVGDAIQPSHPLSSSSPAFNLSQQQGFFQIAS